MKFGEDDFLEEMLERKVIPRLFAGLDSFFSWSLDIGVMSSSWNMASGNEDISKKVRRLCANVPEWMICSEAMVHGRCKVYLR